MTRNTLCTAVWISTTLCVPAFAQGLQNWEIIFLGGRALEVSQTEPGTGVMVAGSAGYSYHVGYAYQIRRFSAADLWLEVPQTFSSRHDRLSSTSGTTRQSLVAITPGLRLQRSLSDRLSVYGAAGGGFGSFQYYRPSTNSTSAVSPWPTGHGVFDFAAGIDLRLSRAFSIRGEVRDFVTGKGLSGATGRQHIVYLFGGAIHF